ncbi:MAG: sulfite exporter TauE/SafE family protein [Anaerostipes sp.]|nr:sulfite exporter TauE/SafE family protein [Anaerostipes sp.]
MRQVLFLIVLFVANVVQAITGFAGTLLAMPVSMILIGVHEAKVILNIMAFLSCLGITIKNRRDIQIKILGKILIFMGIGMAVGIWLFERISLSFLLPLYGLIIIFIACKKLFIKKEFQLPAWGQTGILIGAGIIHGMFVSGGALLVVYATEVLKKKEAFRATIAPVWVVLNSFLMISDWTHGYMSHKVLALTGYSILPLFLAVILGNWIHKKINQKVFLKITYVLLLLSGFSIFI